HRLAGCGAGFEQTVPQELIRRDFVERDVGFELLDRLEIEGRAGKLNAAFARATRKRFKMRDGQFPFHACAMLCALSENFGREQLFDTKELELYRIAAAARRCIDEFQCARKILAMITRCFSNE